MEGILVTVSSVRHSRSRGLALIVLVLSGFVSGLDTAILSVALPRIAVALHATNAESQWLFAAYLVPMAGVLIVCTSIASRFGRRKVLLASLAISGFASIGAARADDVVPLILCRAVLGIGAAGIVACTLTTLPALFPPREQGRALAVWSAGISLGLPIGPLVSGWLLEHFWWGSVFLVNVPLVLAALAGACLWLPESRGPASLADWPGAALLMVGLAALTYGLTTEESYGWHSPLSILCLLVAIALIAAFAVRQHQRPQPRIFSRSHFTQAAIVQGAAYLALIGFLYVLLPCLELDRAMSPLRAGVWTLPMIGALVVGGVVSAGVSRRMGSAMLSARMIAPLAIIAGGLLLLASAGAAVSTGDLVAALIVTGLGVGSALSSATAGAGETDGGQLAVSVLLTAAFRQAGGVVGVALLGSDLGAGQLASIWMGRGRGSGTPGTPNAAVDDALLAGAVAVLLCMVIAASLSLGRLHPVSEASTLPARTGD
jgi:MFS transporter, DHA2 family, multidrug resistance protein